MEFLTAIPFQLDFNNSAVLLCIVSIVLLLTCLQLIVATSLLKSTLLMSVLSLSISLCYVLMDAPDVAMTEVALGSCLSTCVLLNLTQVVGNGVAKPTSGRTFIAIAICSILFASLIWASLDLPDFGALNSPMQTHLTKYFIENTKYQIGIPSIVAAILASYRGFDTLGETSVILIAGLAVVVIMSRKRNDA